MLRRLQPTTGFPSSIRGYRKGFTTAKRLLGASSRSIHVDQHHHIVGRPHNAKPDKSHVQCHSFKLLNSMRSLTTFHRTLLVQNDGDETITKSICNNINDDEEEMRRLQMSDFPEGASLHHKEWLDTTILSTTSNDCKKETRRLIMARIQKEIPLLIQDYLSSSSSSASSRDLDDDDDDDENNNNNSLFVGKRHRNRHGNTSLDARYQKQLKWIRKRTTVSSSPSSSSSSTIGLNTNDEEQPFTTTTVEELPGNQVVQPTTAIIGGAGQENQWYDSSSSSVQDDVVVDGDDDDDDDWSYVEEEEELTPWESTYLADSIQTADAGLVASRPPVWQRVENTSSTRTTMTATTTTLLLDSCLALLHAMSKGDWAVVDGQSLLLTDDDEDDGSTHDEIPDAEFDAGHFTSSNKALPHDDDDSEKDVSVSSTQEEEDDDDDDDNNVDYVDDEFFWTLRQLKLGDVSLESTDDYNLVLARIALSAELDHDDILEALLDTLQQIKKAGACALGDGPNATTYEILLLIMDKRLQSFRAALDLVRRDMVQTSSSSSSSTTPQGSRLITTATLEASMKLCEMSGDLNLARELWKLARPQKGVDDAAKDDDADDSNHKDTAVKITNRVHHSMLNLFKAVDSRDEAIETLRIGLQDNGRQINEGLDKVFINAIQWPNRNRKGEPIDNLPVIVSILDALDEDMFYTPGLPVLKQLLITAAKGAQQDDHARWKVVQRIFHRIASSYPAFQVDHVVLRIGLEASEAIPDPTLAAELITRMLDSEFSGKSFGLMATDIPSKMIRQSLVPNASLYAHNEGHQFAQQQESGKSAGRLLSSKSILRAMDVCVNCGDVVSARRILDCVQTHYNAAQIPKAIRQRLFVSTLKVCATSGQAQVAEHLLSVMLSSDLAPIEEAFGAVIHGYVINKSSEKAHGLLNDVQSGRFGDDIAPGPTSYNAIILDYIQNKAWSDALERYDEMRKRGVVPLASTYVGLLLSSFKEGGRSGAMSFVDDLVRTNARVNGETCMMALRLLIPEIAKSADIDDMRSQLRSLSDEKPLLTPALLNLNRALRLAELEEKREPSKGLPQAKVSERRASAWHDVLKQLAKSSGALLPDQDEKASS